MSRSVEVFVVDTPRAASVALGVARADAESTHVLCRHQDEATRDFERRVLRRIERIQKSRRVRSLWYVVGTDAARGRCSVPLLQSLLPLLESGSSLTVVGPGSHQSAVFQWIDSIRNRRGNITLRAQLYSENGEATPFYSDADESSLYPDAESSLYPDAESPLYPDADESLRRVPVRARVLTARAVDERSASSDSKPFAPWFSRDAAGGPGAADTHAA